MSRSFRSMWLRICELQEDNNNLQCDGLMTVHDRCQLVPFLVSYHIHTCTSLLSESSLLTLVLIYCNVWRVDDTVVRGLQWLCAYVALVLSCWGLIAGGTYAPHTTIDAIKLMTLRFAIYIR